MKAISAAVLGLALFGALVPASAQYYDGRGDGYRDRGDYGPRDRGYDREDRGYDRGDRGYGDDRGYRSRNRGDYAFDEQEYLRCNPDVRRAVVNGQMESGLAHYRKFGVREGRRLSC